MKKIVCLLLVWCFMLINLNAAPAYKWQFMAIASEDYPYLEVLNGKTVATQNHGGDWVQVLVDVLGTGDYTRVNIEFGSDMTLLEKFDLVNSSNVIVGTRYNFVKYNNIYSSGLIRAFDHSTVKATLGFN